MEALFVTKKRRPGDFDACYVESGMNFSLLRVKHPIFFDFNYERKNQKLTFYGEFLPSTAIADQTNQISYLDFFQIDKETGTAKGIIGYKL